MLQCLYSSLCNAVRLRMVGRALHLGYPIRLTKMVHLLRRELRCVVRKHDPRNTKAAEDGDHVLVTSRLRKAALDPARCWSISTSTLPRSEIWHQSICTRSKTPTVGQELRFLVWEGRSLQLVGQLRIQGGHWNEMVATKQTTWTPVWSWWQESNTSWQFWVCSVIICMQPLKCVC